MESLPVKIFLYYPVNKTYQKRDRAAERLAFHGGFGVGPGQKTSTDDVETTSSVFYSTDQAVAEAFNMSFGAGSYTKRMLENMGWKEDGLKPVVEIAFFEMELLKSILHRHKNPTRLMGTAIPLYLGIGIANSYLGSPKKDR
ncbi:hypothetical protein GIB67_016074 [Kingdonia uniflora]|uniref:Uncharacterized protein n=1 Tax=Kingdonia uniflora TaxID=39325 RepID=A0A7J7L219_9MAGN|nr:hypothetical protein GIB67_016074 [Kingdonia uniflora]